MTRLRLALAAAAVAALAGAAPLAPAALAGPSRHAGAPCRSGELSGRFAVVPGSAGAGNIVYALQVKNVSGTVCSVTGLPHMQLLSAAGKPLPTEAMSAHIGMGTAVIVVLAKGESAWSSARFSPDVPGPKEQAGGPCEPVATKVRVTVGTASARLTAPIVPPTRVCVSGHMAVTTLSKVKPTA